MLPFVSTPVMSRRLPASISRAARAPGRRRATRARRSPAARPELDGRPQGEPAVLVHDAEPRLDEAVLGIELLRARDLTFHVQGVADLHRLLEDGVAKPAQ